MGSKCSTLKSKTKKMLYAKIREYKDEIINFVYLKEQLVKTNSLEELDLLKILKIESLNEFSKCIFFEGYSGWISLNSENKQRYFTQKGKKKYALDIYDILEIYFNCSYNQIFNRLLEFGFDVNHFNVECENVLEHISNTKFKQLFISETSCIYKALIDFNKGHNIVNGEGNIFFISTRYLKEEYNIPYAISTINQVINIYDCLGLINKIPESKIQNKKVKNCLKLKKNLNKISFYSLNRIKDLAIINEKIDILFKERISYYNLSSANKKKLKTKYKELFNDVSDNNIKPKTKVSIESEELGLNIKRLFSKYSDEKGVVAKEWLENEIEGVSKALINKEWSILTNKNIGRVVRPNKRLKSTLGLNTNQDVFIIKKLTI